MNTSFTPIYIDLIPTEQTVYFTVALRPRGIGTKQDPYGVANGDLDSSVSFRNCIAIQSIKIIFGEGRFFTSGFALPLNTCVIVGQGAGKTVIQFKDNIDSVEKNWSWPHIRMISDRSQYCLNFGIRDITLDGNWRGQPWAITNGNSKIEPLVVNSVRGKCERVDIVDFGCHASKELYPVLGLESFPLALLTVSMGPPYDRVFPEHEHRGDEPASFLEIANCRILSATFLGGGYCTAAFVVTNQPSAGDRLPIGARTTLAAWVHDNYVEDISGIAFGCASSEHVMFERNHTKSRVGFNCDTGRCENIELRDNVFLKNNHGVNFSPDGGGKGLLVEGNTILYGPRGVNSITGLPEGYVGLSIADTIDAFTKGNTLIGPSDWEATRFSNYPVTSDDTRLVIGGEGTPTPANDSDLVASLQATVRDQLTKLNAGLLVADELNSTKSNLFAVTLERNKLMDRQGVLIAESAIANDSKKVLEQKIFECVKRASYAETERDEARGNLKTVKDDVEDFLMAQDRLKTHIEIEDP